MILYIYLYTALFCNIIFFSVTLLNRWDTQIFMSNLCVILGIIAIFSYILLVVTDWKQARKLVMILLLIFPIIMTLAKLNDLAHFNRPILEIFNIKKMP